MSGRQCSWCGEVKDFSEFHRCKNRKDGLRSQCKACGLESQRRYRVENREAVREKGRRYREENRETVLANQRRHEKKKRDMARESATRTGETYTSAEDAHILASDEPLAVIAVELGRTLNSVNKRRGKLRKAATA